MRPEGPGQQRHLSVNAVSRRQVTDRPHYISTDETPARVPFTIQSTNIYWRCGRSEDTSRVRDISVGGVFIETKKSLPLDATVELNFLVEDGGIVAKAAVRYVLPSIGIGLQFKTVRTEDQPLFAAMIKRIIR